MAVYNTYLKPNYTPIIPESDKETAAEEKTAAETAAEEKTAAETVPAETKAKKAAKKG